jgi:ferredoxin
MHCVDPSCVSACTVGALEQNEDGIITYDDDVCIGCRYCMYACPFEVPHFEWNKQLALIVKCDLCVSRLAEGQTEPACAATCPTDAIQFGKREDMRAMAHERIKNEPDRYVNHVFGEYENGGTSTFYLSPVPFEELHFPSVETDHSPAEFNRIATEEGTPIIAGVAALGMASIYLALEHFGKKKAKETPKPAEAEIESAEEKEQP